MWENLFAFVFLGPLCALPTLWFAWGSLVAARKLRRLRPVEGEVIGYSTAENKDGEAVVAMRVRFVDSAGKLAEAEMPLEPEPGHPTPSAGESVIIYTARNPQTGEPDARPTNPTREMRVAFMLALLLFAGGGFFGWLSLVALVRLLT